MSGLQVNVRQIASYPLQARAGQADLVLVQQGGLGGPYYTTTPLGLLAPLESSNLAVGVGLPAAAGRGNLVAQHHVVARDGDVLFNAYRSAAGYCTGQGGMAARLSFTPVTEGLEFGVSPQQPGDTPIAAFVPYLRLDPAGSLRLFGGTLKVARDPGTADEVATLGWVNRAVATSFNGRRGAVRLMAADVYHALGLPPEDALASRRAVTFALQQLLTGNPFVFTWQGRLGNVFLQLADIEGVYFAPGARPQAPNPPLFDASNQIATTAWVTRYLTDKWWADITRTFAPLASPDFLGKPLAPNPDPASDDNQLATTAWVRSVLTSVGAGVLQWNGRSGFVQFELADLNDVTMAPGAVPLAPTAVSGTATTQIASTAFVTAADQQIVDNSVWTWNGRKGDVTLLLADILGASGQQQTALGAVYPATPSNGQFFFNPATRKLEIWTGTAWEVAGGAVEISDTVPTTEYHGKLWWDSADGDLYIYFQGTSGGQWVVIGSQAGPPGQQGPQGNQGIPGIQGPAGPGLRPMGNVPTFTALPTTGQQAGDLWVTSDTSTGYAWSAVANDWVNLGPLGSGMPDAPATGDNYGRQAQGGPGGPMDWQQIQDDGSY